jgi:RNA polymerase sigma-70 factor
MMTSTELSVIEMIRLVYATGREFHGDFGLTPDDFAERVRCVIAKHLGPTATNSEALSLCKKLYLHDLYLSLGCSRSNDAAWLRFSRCYEKYIHDVARFVCSTTDAARELGDCLVGHIFLPDRTGRSRIASYDGRCSLRTWLRAIIKNRAIDERELRSNNNETLDCLPETSDQSSLNRISLSTRAGRYEAMNAQALKQAVEALSTEDRRLLALKYIEGLNGTHLAELLGVHPTTATRQLSRVQSKVRERVISILATRFLLTGPAIDECLTDMVENPAHSVLQFLGSF